jgi:hypothetical protein
MSIHYDFALACDLKPDTPQQVLDTLAYMTRSADYPFHDPPAHPLFGAQDIDGEAVEDWRIMLHERESRFPGEAGSRLRPAYRYTQHGVDQYRYTFSFRQEVLDDAIGEYIALAQWLALYSETEGWVGYFRADLDDGGAQPVLLYFKQGRVYMSDSTQSPKDIATGAPWPTER